VAPAEPAQRRYEALRAYFVEGLAAAEAGARFGYSAATMHQLASDLRAGRVALLVSGKPGPKGPRTALRVRGRVLELRAADGSVTEIAAALTAAGTPVSAQTVWSILAAEGLERLPRRDRTGTGAPPRAAAAKAQVARTWPAGTALASDFAGLFLLLPAMVELGVEELVRGAGYPGTSVHCAPGDADLSTGPTTTGSAFSGRSFVVGGVPVRLELETSGRRPRPARPPPRRRPPAAVRPAS